MYQASTRSITVTVEPSYLEDDSTPAKHEFRWAYRVRIENRSKGTVQLLSRYWRITDALGRIQEVHGPGVVGEQPVLEPGHAFEYQSWTPLQTPWPDTIRWKSRQAASGSMSPFRPSRSTAPTSRSA
jgi:ApaG protein